MIAKKSTISQLSNVQKKNLTSKLWRLNNLYTIVTKKKEQLIMKLNRAQTRILTQFKHPRKIILKSRQQGISTLYLAYNLDSCITKSNFSAGIQSYGKSESQKLSLRAQIMWDNLPKAFKEELGIDVVKNNSEGMHFSNGSVLKIGNFRGDTLQSLHVSELAKIAATQPQKASELQSGAFEAVGQGNKITIESTAEGKVGLFYKLWEKAYTKMQINAELSPFDFEAIFLSWIHDPDCNINTPQPIDAQTEEYFRTLEERLDVQLEQTQKWWYVAKLDTLGDLMKREYPSYPEEAFEQSVEGTIFEKEYKKLVKEKRIQKNLMIQGHETIVSYDLGMNDKTVLTFHQIYLGRPRIVYIYANSGEKFEHYAHIIASLQDTHKLIISQVILPHDGNVRDYQSGRTRLETAHMLGLPAIVQKRQSLADGIQATRQYLSICLIDSDTCMDGILAIQSYRWKYDRTLEVYLQVPQHDDASNYCDSIRYGALGIPYDSTLRKYDDKKGDTATFDFDRGGSVFENETYIEYDGHTV